MNNDAKIISKLINQQYKFKELLSELIKQRDFLFQSEDPAIFPDINKQFKEQSFKIMADQIAKDLALPTEEIYNVLENLNLDEYLRL